MLEQSELKEILKNEDLSQEEIKKLIIYNNKKEKTNRYVSYVERRKARKLLKQNKLKKKK